MIYVPTTEDVQEEKGSYGLVQIWIKGSWY